MEMKPPRFLGERLSANPAVLQCLSSASKRVYTVLRAGGCSRVGAWTGGSGGTQDARQRVRLLPLCQAIM
jgi:hypothetical protein